MSTEVNKNDPEDCEACGDGLCLYHEGWVDGSAAIGRLFAAVAEDPEAAWDAYMRLKPREEVTPDA